MRACWHRWSNNWVLRVCVELNIKHSLPLRRHRLGHRLRSEKGRNGDGRRVLSSWEVPFIKVGPFTNDGMLRSEIPELPTFVACRVAKEH